MDAAVMAAIASLRHYRKPHVDLVGGGGGDGNSDGRTTNENTTSSSSGAAAASAITTPILIPSHLKEPTPLPLHHTPLSISFAFIALEDGSSLSTAATAASTTAPRVIMSNNRTRKKTIKSWRVYYQTNDDDDKDREKPAAVACFRKRIGKIAERSDPNQAVFEVVTSVIASRSR